MNLAQGAAAAQIIATISAAVGASVSQAEIQFTWTPTGTASTNDWFSVDDLDLRVVPTGLPAAAPTFERSDFWFDLMRCLRFYSKSFELDTAPAQNVGVATGEQIITQIVGAGTATILGHVRFPVRKRVAATVTLYNTSAANGEARNQNVPADCIGTGIEYQSQSGFTVYTTTPVASAAGNKIGFHWTASAEI